MNPTHLVNMELDGCRFAPCQVEVLFALGGFFVHTDTDPPWAGFTVSHAGSGQACAKGFREFSRAVAMATRLARSELDWDVQDRNELTDLHQDVGRKIRHEFAGDFDCYL